MYVRQTVQWNNYEQTKRIIFKEWNTALYVWSALLPEINESILKKVFTKFIYDEVRMIIAKFAPVGRCRGACIFRGHRFVMAAFG